MQLTPSQVGDGDGGEHEPSKNKIAGGFVVDVHGDQSGGRCQHHVNRLE